MLVSHTDTFCSHPVVKFCSKDTSQALVSKVMRSNDNKCLVLGNRPHVTFYISINHPFLAAF